jgi:hypothetical protein
MNKILILILLFQIEQCSSQITNSRTLVKYVPFSAKFNIRVSENDMNNIKSSEGTVVKYDTINIDSINKLIGNQLESIKKSSGIYAPYDLRMECTYEYEKKVTKFYFDNKKNIIYSGRIFENQVLYDLIFLNICRPYFSLFLEDEKKYWSSDQRKCDDSIEFYKNNPQFIK